MMRRRIEWLEKNFKKKKKKKNPKKKKEKYKGERNQLLGRELLLYL